MWAMSGFREYFNTIDASSDINLLFTGREACSPGKICRGSRSHILLHFVIQGSGWAGDSETPMQLHRGGVFCFFPDRPHYYRSSSREPWEYLWAGFRGSRGERILRSCGFTSEAPAQMLPFSFPMEQLFAQLFSVQQRREEGFGTVSDGLLLQMLGVLKAAVSAERKGNRDLRPEDYAAAMKHFMDTNFQKPISVSQVTAYSGLERSYSSRIFKSVTGLTIQRYLIELRMSRARELLASGALSVAEVACSVGYDQYATFERCFRREHGYPPGSCRRQFQFQNQLSR